MKTPIGDLIKFIRGYRKMEDDNLLLNKKLIKAVVSKEQYNHLVDSWSGRNNDFGDFFLNLSYQNQGLFLLHWNVNLPGFEEFQKEVKTKREAYLYAVPPIELLEIVQLVLLFNNNGIDKYTLPEFSFNNLPHETFGNSKNWGNYLLSLGAYDQVNFFMCYGKKIAPRIAELISEIESWKPKLLTKTQ